ncbi:MAG: hypothetical protein KDD47_17790, partial [Acidobacteria bacterium]|nr:hypothetical protein [Acidobacteriota bacterium]
TTPYVLLEVLANDYDPNCGTLTLESVNHTSGLANVTVSGSTRIRYAPVYGAAGTDTFTYTLRDLQGYRAQGTVTVELTGEIEPPWPRISYRSCAELDTCVADGSDSRRGDGSLYHWGNCTSYWHLEGYNSQAPDGTLPCTPAYHRAAVQDMADSYAQPTLAWTELTLDDFAAGGQRARDASGRFVPVGGTTTEWTIGHACVQGTCTFWPVGNWLEGVVGRFQWFFDGLRYSGGQLDPDAEMLSADPLVHTYASAAAGDSFEVYLVIDVFDRPNGITKSLWITVPPPPPSAPTGLATDNTICEATGPRLIWVDASHNEEGFTIYRSVNGGSMVELASVDADETELQDFYDGPREDLLTYRVAAFNAGGEASSETVTGRPTPGDCGAGQQVPAAPSLLTAQPPANGVRLTWRDNSALEAGHRLYRSEAGGPFLLRATLGPNQETYFDQPLSPGETYSYRVTAFNAVGESPPTPDVSLTVPPFLFADSFESGDVSAWSSSQGAVAPPSGLTEGSLVNLGAAMSQHLLRPSEVRATGFRRSGVELAWRDNSSNEAGFRLLRKEKGGPYQEIASLPADATVYFDHPLEPGKPYRYRVVAYTADGKQKRSEVARIEVPEEVFLDSFERRRLSSEWAEVDPESRLRLAFEGALFGNRGLEVELGGSSACLATDVPSEELRLRGRFLLDARRVEPGAGVVEGQPFVTILEGSTEAGAGVFSLRLVKMVAGLGVEVALTSADGSTLTAPTAELDGRVHLLEWDWQAEGADGTGRFRLWLDDRRKVDLTGWAAGDLKVGKLSLGSVSLADGSGFLVLDELLLRRGGKRLRRQELAGELLQEGFEFSTLGDWKIFAQAGGELALVPAALEGDQALEASISASGQKAYAERRLYHPEHHLVASFLLDASAFSLPAGTKQRIFEAVSPESGDALFDLQLEPGEAGLEVKARALDGPGRSRRSLPLPAGPARVEVEWRRATGPGAADGSLVLRVTDEATDDSPRRTLEGLDTGPERVQLLRLGATDLSDAGAQGQIIFDLLEVWR